MSDFPDQPAKSRKGRIRSVQNFPIFLINLDSSQDRREVMISHLADLGLDFQIVSAVDGSKLSPEMVSLYSAAAARRAIGRELLPGEIGCALSHILVYRQMLQKRINVALIIEDDVALAEELVPVLISAIENYQDWELLNLITDVEEHLLANHVLTSPHTLTCFRTMPNRTGAYLLRLSGARKLLDSALPVRMAADTLTGDFQGTGLALRGVFPPIATLRPFKSTFQRGNYPPKSIVWARKLLRTDKPDVATLNPKLIPSRAWVFLHTIRSYLGSIKRVLMRALQLSSVRR